MGPIVTTMVTSDGWKAIIESPVAEELSPLASVISTMRKVIS